MTQSAESERARPPDKDRREIAKRIFDALCAKYPEKYVALMAHSCRCPSSSVRAFSIFRRRGGPIHFCGSWAGYDAKNGWAGLSGRNGKQAKPCQL